MKIPDSLKRYGLAKVYDYLDKDPMNNMGKVMDLVNKFAGDTLSLQREAFDKVINDKDSCCLLYTSSSSMMARYPLSKV